MDTPKSPFAELVKRAQEDCQVYCPICHKILEVKAGEVIPRCCGRVMEKM